MCTRNMVQVPPSDKDAPESPFHDVSSSSSLEKPKLSSSTTDAKMGPYGAYHDPLLPPSDLLKRIVGDGISMSGGPAAVLLQIAHPKVGAGVAENSSFTTRPIARGRRSIIYIFCQVFGTKEERRYITDMTHRSHAKIVKAATADDSGYNANDPELQLWVAATTYWSLIESYQACYGRFADETAERLHKEFSVMATALHVPPEMWPKDRKAFQVYWDEQIAKLSVNDAARAVAHDVLFPSKLPFWYTVYFNLVGPLSRIVTREMLPPTVAKQFNWESTAWSRTVYNTMVVLTKIGYRYQPYFTKTLVKDVYMKDMRKRIKEGRRW